MTKKDFQLIAEALLKADKMGAVHELDTLAHVVGYALQPTNPRFNLNKFLDKCGVTE